MVYHPAKQKLAKHGINYKGKTSRQLRKEVYDAYDLLIGMDYGNLCGMRRICGDDAAGKMHLLLDFTKQPRDITALWYTDDFDTAWKDIEAGCRSRLEYWKRKGI